MIGKAFLLLQVLSSVKQPRLHPPSPAPPPPKHVLHTNLHAWLFWILHLHLILGKLSGSTLLLIIVFSCTVGSLTIPFIVYCILCLLETFCFHSR